MGISDTSAGPGLTVQLAVRHANLKPGTNLAYPKQQRSLSLLLLHLPTCRYRGWVSGDEATSLSLPNVLHVFLPGWHGSDCVVHFSFFPCSQRCLSAPVPPFQSLDACLQLLKMYENANISKIMLCDCGIMDFICRMVRIQV